MSWNKLLPSIVVVRPLNLQDCYGCSIFALLVEPLVHYLFVSATGFWLGQFIKRPEGIRKRVLFFYGLQAVPRFCY